MLHLTRTVGSYRTKYITNIITYRQFLCIKERVSSKTRGVDKPHFSVLCSSPVVHYLKSVAVMAITYQLLPWLSQSTSKVLGVTRLQDGIYSETYARVFIGNTKIN